MSNFPQEVLSDLTLTIGKVVIAIGTQSIHCAIETIIDAGICLLFSIGGNMVTELEISLAIAYAPSINHVIKTACLVIRLAVLKRYGIIKPTSRRTL
ncbi:hypothetical protein [Siccibacter colletis]|uniref:Uncharacterized protein n=1 Tax=Siccibacter colletis TaxID=1505757 RepID=A0ABY6J8Z5_9ENTR|nr:hypothetical protein [Siccibacter colletis]UYU30290.1 hypothetical protein KFZ77_10275 [Siccibacter colletis]